MAHVALNPGSQYCTLQLRDLPRGVSERIIANALIE